MKVFYCFGCLCEETETVLFIHCQDCGSAFCQECLQTKCVYCIYKNEMNAIDSRLSKEEASTGDTMKNPVKEEEEDFGFVLVDGEALQKEHDDNRDRKQAFHLHDIPPEVKEKLCSNWPPLDDHTLLTYPMNTAKQEMARDSIFKAQAKEAGLIRPFLWLVSMHPLTRYSLARSMKIKLEKYPAFGNSHFEAYHMAVGHPIKSLRSRVGLEGFASGNWFSILCHVVSACLGKSSRIDERTKQVISYCRRIKVNCIMENVHPEEKDVRLLEETYLAGLYEVMDSIRREHQKKFIPPEWKYTIDLAASDIIEPFKENLKTYGNFTNNKLMGILAATALRSRVFHMTNKLEQWTDRKSTVLRFFSLVKIAIPATMLTLNIALAAASITTLSPIVLVPAFFLSVNLSKGVLGKHSDPLAVLLPISAIISQREILAYHQIAIESYYDSDIIPPEVPSEKKLSPRD